MLKHFIFERPHKIWRFIQFAILTEYGLLDWVNPHIIYLLLIHIAQLIKSHMRLRGVNELFIHPYGWTNDSFTPRWMMKYSFDKASSKRKIYSVYNQYWISVGWLNKSSYLTLPSLCLLISGILHWNFYCLLMSYLIIPLLILLVNSLPFVFWSFFFAILLLYTDIGFSNPCLLGILILAILHRTFSKIFKSLTS